MISLNGPPAEKMSARKLKSTVSNRLSSPLTLGSLCHIPLDNVRFGDTNVLGQLHGTLATATQLQDDEYFDGDFTGGI